MLRFRPADRRAQGANNLIKPDILAAIGGPARMLGQDCHQKKGGGSGGEHRINGGKMGARRGLTLPAEQARQQSAGGLLGELAAKAF